MTDDAVMQDLFTKFQHFKRSGKDAHLSLECHAGQAWVHLHVRLPQPDQHAQNQRKPGPSRLRRRARRAEARAAAEVAVAAAVNESGETNSKLVEDAIVSKTSEIAVQADLHPHPCNAAHGPTEKVDEALDQPAEPEDEDAEISTTKTTSIAAHLNVNADPWPRDNVHDVFCPDPEYLPQLQKPQAPPNQCTLCGKTFGSNRALTSHAKRDHSM